MKKEFLCLLAALSITAVPSVADNMGGIDAAMLGRLKASYNPSGAQKALRNAMNLRGIQSDKSSNSGTKLRQR